MKVNSECVWGVAVKYRHAHIVWVAHVTLSRGCRVLYRILNEKGEGGELSMLRTNSPLDAVC